MRTADGDVGSPEGSSEEDEDDSGSGSEDDSSGEDESEEGSGSEASDASEASGSELDLALAEDGRVACPLLPHLTLDAFRAFPNAFALDDAAARRTLLADCDEAFTARAATKKKGPYSSGETYWLAADAEPRCALERLAKHVFDAHTRDAVARFVRQQTSNESDAEPFDRSRSGAEWWTQVLNNDDEIGVHWDKDYALEAADLNVHPQIGTVTYFSSTGAPTLMARKPTPTFFSESVAGAFEDLETEDGIQKNFRSAREPEHASARAFLSFPAFGKHVAFDGRWLHGALPELSRKEKKKTDPDREETTETKRVTFLVNVWLNHVPSTATPLPERALRRMAPLGAYVFARGDTFMELRDDDAVESVDVAKLGATKEIQRAFAHAESTFLMRTAFPATWLEGEAPKRGGSFALVGTGGEVVEVRDSEKKKRKRP